MDSQSPHYLNLFTEGFVYGENPYADLSLILTLDPEMDCDPFIDGFDRGRRQYEKLNGPICNGIPDFIMNERTAEVFKTEGLTGGRLDLDGLSPHQAKVARAWYRKGIEKHDPECDVALAGLLAKNDIGFIVRKN